MDGVDEKSVTRDVHFIHIFCRQQRDLESVFSSLKKSLFSKGLLWVSWPKRTSAVTTDLNENVIRGIGLAHEMVDVKVCAIDETWSGLKFVFRLRDRR